MSDDSMNENRVVKTLEIEEFDIVKIKDVEYMVEEIETKDDGKWVIIALERFK